MAEPKVLLCIFSYRDKSKSSEKFGKVCTDRYDELVFWNLPNFGNLPVNGFDIDITVVGFEK